MKRPPNLVITLGVAALAFGVIVLVKRITSPDPPAPWLTDEAAAFAKARETHKAVLIDLSATWSLPSEEMSRSLDKLAPVIDRDFVRLRIDISNGNDDLRDRYGAATIPAVVMVTTDGRVLRRITELLDTEQLRAAIAR